MTVHFGHRPRPQADAQTQLHVNSDMPESMCPTSDAGFYQPDRMHQGQAAEFATESQDGQHCRVRKAVELSWFCCEMGSSEFADSVACNTIRKESQFSISGPWAQRPAVACTNRRALPEQGRQAWNWTLWHLLVTRPNPTSYQKKVVKTSNHTANPKLPSCLVAGAQPLPATSHQNR